MFCDQGLNANPSMEAARNGSIMIRQRPKNQEALALDSRVLMEVQQKDSIFARPMVRVKCMKQRVCKRRNSPLPIV
jgi:hypothetical protein